MATGKTHEFKDTIYSEIPDEVAEKLDIEPGQEIEFKNPYKDLIILIPKQKRKEKSKKGLRESELKVLKKIGGIKHWERTPKNIKNQLNENEEKTFNKMLAKDVLFEYEKEGETRIGIDQEYFPLATKETKEKPKKLINKLETNGYVIIKDEEDAKKLQEEIRKKEKTEEIKGVRGFDKKYYIIKKDKLNEIKEELKNILDEEKIIHEISEDLNLKENLCKTALVVLREDGEVVEKGKNIYICS